jgi:hypothetical protein
MACLCFISNTPSFYSCSTAAEDDAGVDKGSGSSAALRHHYIIPQHASQQSYVYCSVVLITVGSYRGLVCCVVIVCRCCCCCGGTGATASVIYYLCLFLHDDFPVAEKRWIRLIQF